MKNTIQPRVGTTDRAAVREAVPVPTAWGAATIYSFTGLPDGKEHFVLGFGDWMSQEVPLVRVHSECITGDLFQSRRCDCGEQLGEALRCLGLVGGLLVYLRQEGRGIGLYNKLDAYQLQLQGMDTFQANRALGLPEDGRDYSVAVSLFKALGVERFRLLTNNPDKVRQLQAGGLFVVEAVPTGTYLKKENADYLRAKVEVTGHTIALG